MNTQILNISGMTCGGCASSVQRVLSALEGVSRVEVDWQQGRAEVEFDAQKTTLETLIETVENAGFDAQAV